MKKNKVKDFYHKLKNSHGKLTLKKCWSLFFVFFRIGLFTFGGGYAMLPLIQREIVEKKKWMTDIEIMDVLIISESTPGPVSINTATYVGYRVGGFFGSLIATLSLVLPSFIIIFVISLFFDEFIKIKWVKNAFIGIQAAVAVLIISAAEKLFKKMKKTAYFCILTVVTTIAAIVFKFFNIDFSTINFILIAFGLSISLCAMSMLNGVEEGKDGAIPLSLKEVEK